MRLSVLLIAVTASSIIVDNKNIATGFRQQSSKPLTTNVDSGQFVIMGNCTNKHFRWKSYAIRVQRKDRQRQTCYIKVTSPVSFVEEAELICRNLLGHLFSVEDAEEYNFLLGDLISRSHAFYMGYNHTKKEFYDGTDTSWLLKNIPKNEKGECVAVIKSAQDKKYKLKLLPMPTMPFGILCKSDPSLTEDFENRYVISEPCPEKPNKTYAYSWMVNVDNGKEKYCLFYLKTKTPENKVKSFKQVGWIRSNTISFEDAEKDCEGFGGHLLSISNGLEQTAVSKALIKSLKDKEIFGKKSILLGLKGKNSENLTFTDGVDGAYVVKRARVFSSNGLYGCFSLVFWSDFNAVKTNDCYNVSSFVCKVQLRQSKEEKGGKKFWIWIVLVIIIAIVLGVTFFALRKRQDIYKSYDSSSFFDDLQYGS